MQTSNMTPPSSSDGAGRAGRRPSAPVVALIAAVTAACAGLLSVAGLQWDGVDIGFIAALAIVTIISERTDVSVFGNSRVSVSVAAIIAAGALEGFPGVAVIASVAVLADYLGRGKPAYKALFNEGVLVLAGAASVGAFRALDFGDGVTDWPSVLLLPAFAAAFANFAVNSVLVAAVIALDTKDSFSGIWQEKFFWLVPHYLVVGVLGVVLASAYVVFGLSAFAMILLPLVMMWLAIRQYVSRTTTSVVELREATRGLKEAHQVREAYGSVLTRLTAAIERPDHPRVGHAERVVQISLAIAEKMGLQPDSRTWEELRLGALFHDIGQVAVPEKVLRQSGKLSEEDWYLIKQHPSLGYDLLADAKSLRGAAEIVLSHHERFNGEGYPRSLSGERIPLGARIFAVADAFDAMTSDLAYRRAMPKEAAVEEIRRCRGSQFDPQVVDAFLSIYGTLDGNGHRAHAFG
ncbi:MAG: HD domain-containing protein [Chloroflexi bacterium]|nr:HD domain-containing protein [Chloroflexota bacterium]